MNNISILNKCLKELGEATPRLDYVRGMLETLIELQSPIFTSSVTSDIHAASLVPGAVMQVPLDKPKDEGQILDDIAKARLAGVKAASHVELS